MGLAAGLAMEMTLFWEIGILGILYLTALQTYSVHRTPSPLYVLRFNKTTLMTLQSLFCRLIFQSMILMMLVWWLPLVSRCSLLAAFSESIGRSPLLLHCRIATSAKEGRFYPAFVSVCLFVCLSVSRITKKLLTIFCELFLEGCGV